MAISDYLTVISEQRDLLKSSLKQKNVFVDNCTTFNQLTQKISEISGTSKTGLQNGVWTPTVSTDTFNLSGLDFVPSKLAICCEDVLTKHYTSAAEHINIAILNIELTAGETAIIENGLNTGITVDSSDFSADITVTETNGLYSISVSFADVNKTLEIPYKFKANASHVWCASQEGWQL